MSQLIDLYIDQGSDFLAVMPPVTASNGSIVDLTTYTTVISDVTVPAVVAMIRRSYASLYAVQLTVAVPSPITGVINLSLPANETVGLTPTRYVYDVVITSSTGIVTKVFEGLVTVNPGVSSTPNTILLTPFVPDDWGGLT